MPEIKFSFSPEPEPLTKEEIFKGDKECERITRRFRKFKNDIKFLDPEIQSRYWSLDEDDYNIKNLYDREKDVYSKLIKDIEIQLKERKKLINSFNKDVSRKIVKKYFRLLPYSKIDEVSKTCEEYIPSHYSELIKRGDFDFVSELNIVILENFVNEFNKIDINQEIVADMERKDIAEKQREKKLSQKRQRKEMVKELKYCNLELIKLIASHIGLDDKITNENSLDNLNFEDLKQLTEAHNEIRKIIDEYDADVHNKAGREDVIEEWLERKK